MNLHHRPVTEDDIAQICAFARNADELFWFFPKARFPLTAEQLRGAIAQRTDSTVVECAGDVLGFANFYRWEYGGVCCIGNVVVAPTARNRGVARYLMQRMIELAFSTYQASEVRVSCFNHNTAGLLLYPKLGFRPFAVEERQGKAGERLALVHLRRVAAASG